MFMGITVSIGSLPLNFEVCIIEIFNQKHTKPILSAVNLLLNVKLSTILNLNKLLFTNSFIQSSIKSYQIFIYIRYYFADCLFLHG